MRLTDSQKRTYREQGFLFFPELITPREVARLNDECTHITAGDGPEIRHAEDGHPKIVYAPHALGEAFGLVTRLPRLLGVVEQLLDERAYIYQSRVNLKLPFAGDAWSWHQDFPAWHRGDGMPRPHAVMTAVFLHECNVANGPLLLIPGSHRETLDEILEREADVKGYDVQRVSTRTLADLAEAGGITDLRGPAGSVAFIHPTLMHGSAPNLTPWPRSIFYVNFNAVSNRTAANRRPWFMNNTDATPLDTVDDGALGVAS